MFEGFMVCLLLLSSVVVAQDTPPQLLHLGNSYTFQNDLPRRVVESLQATVPALSEVGSATLASGGLRLPDHVERVESGDARWTEALQGEPGRWTWMVLQDQSQVPGFPESSDVWQDSMAAVPILDGWAVEQGARTVLFMTWGRRDGDRTNEALYPDFEAMNARLDAGYQAYATQVSEAGRTIWIAPVGRAFAAVYDRLEAEGTTPEASGSDFHRLYSGDGSHPSSLGTALAAGVFVRALTGWTPNWSEPPTGVEAGDVDWMLEAIDRAVVPFADLPHPWAIRSADYTEPPEMDASLGWVLSHPEQCVTVGVDEEMEPIERLTVGALHGSVGGCGRLWTLDGSDLAVETIGLEPGAAGAVEVAGGWLSVSDSAAPISVSGGTLLLSGVTSEPIWMSSGSLGLAPEVSGTRLEVTGGSLELPAGTADAPSVAFTGSVRLAGSLSVTGLGSASAALLAAESISVGDDLNHDLPTEWSLQVRDEDGRQVLYADLPTDEDSGAAPDGTAEEDPLDRSETDGDSDAGPNAPGGAAAEKGSGCAVAGSATGGLALALGLLAMRRRA